MLGRRALVHSECTEAAGRRVGQHWRFSRTEVTHWLERQMHAYTEQELSQLKGKPGSGLAERG